MADNDQCDLLLDGDRVIFRIVGQGTMAQAPAIRQAAAQALDDGATAFYVDLRQCTHMDSTFIGTLVHLWKQSNASAPVSFTIVGPGDPCGSLLQSMGLHKLLPTCDAVDMPEADNDWQPLVETADRSTHAFQSSLVEAHEELAQLPGPTGQVFRRVADQMAKEFDDREETVT